MIWILAVRSSLTKMRSSPFTETVVEGVHSVVYKPGIEPVPLSGMDETQGLRGTFARGLHRASGLLFSYHGSVAETLFGIGDDIDLIVQYRANGQSRRRTFSKVLFLGDSTVTLPEQNTGVSILVGVPFRVQIPEGETLDDHITDEPEP